MAADFFLYPIGLLASVIVNIAFLLIAMRLARVVRPRWPRTIFAAAVSGALAGATFPGARRWGHRRLTGITSSEIC